MLSPSIEGDSLRFSGAMDKPLGVSGLIEIHSHQAADRGPTVIISAPRSPRLYLDGEIDVLGMHHGGTMDIDGKGFDLSFDSKLFGLYDCGARLWGSDPLNLGEAHLAISMDGRFVSLEETLQGFMKGQVEGARSELGRVRDQLEAKRADFDKAMQEEIGRRREEAGRRRGEANRAVELAESQVKLGQDEVGKLEAEIQRQREIVREEYNRACAALEAGRQELSRWQEQVRSLDDQIREKEARYNSLGYFSGEKIPLKAEITFLQGSRLLADKSLGVAAQALGGLEDAVRGLRDIDADPRVSGLIAAKRVAEEGLATSLRLLEEARGGLSALPDWVIDPELIEAQVRKDLGDMGMEAARKLLEETEQRLGYLVGIEAYITGGTLPVEVHHLAFSTVVKDAAVRRFAVSARLDLLQPGGGRQSLDYNFDLSFDNMPETAASLMRALVTGLLP